MQIIRNIQDFINRRLDNVAVRRRDRMNRGFEEYRREQEIQRHFENDINNYNIDNSYFNAIKYFMDNGKKKFFLNSYKHKSLDTIINIIDHSENDIFIYLTHVDDKFDKIEILRSIDNFLNRSLNSKIYLFKYGSHENFLFFRELEKIGNVERYRNRILIGDLGDFENNTSIDPYNEDDWNTDKDNINLKIDNVLKEYFNIGFIGEYFNREFIGGNINIYIGDQSFLRIENSNKSCNSIFEDKYIPVIINLKKIFI